MSFKIFIVEDHKIMRESLVMYVEVHPDLEVCGAVSTAEDALDQLESLYPDLALIDVQLPAMDGISLIRLIREKWPKLPCLVISGHDSRRYADAALDAGAIGYVMKGDVDEILNAIQISLHALPEGYLERKEG